MRISVSDLDAYRYYRDNEDAELDDLLARLRRETPPTAQMLAGTALHAALENAQEDTAVLEANGHKFKFVAECDVYLPQVRELKGEMQIQTPIGPVTLVGVVDAIGGDIQDHKLTARFDAERYAASYQWRCYLLMFGGRRFVYNVFVGKEDSANQYLIYEFHRFPLYAYPALREDVEREVGQFAVFLDRYNVTRTRELIASVPENHPASQP